MFLNKIVYFLENHHTIKRPKRAHRVTVRVTVREMLRSVLPYFISYPKKIRKRTKIVPITLICDLQTKEMFSKRGCTRM